MIALCDNNTRHGDFTAVQRWTCKVVMKHGKWLRGFGGRAAMRDGAEAMVASGEERCAG